MTDEPPTILHRMTDAGISEARAREHLAAGIVRHEGEQVVDPDSSATGRWVIGPA